MKAITNAVVLALLSLVFSSITFASDNVIYRAILNDDIITPVTAEYISSAIDKAEADKAQCLIIELDTPGGLLSSTRTIVKKILNSNVPIAVFVSPEGARAGSAGVFITLAANIAAMAPSTNIGAAHPVEMGEKKTRGDSFEELISRLLTKKTDKKGKEKGLEKPEETEPMQQKILNDTKAFAASIANERGRNAEWAIKAVEQSASVTNEEAKKLGIIDMIAKDTDDLVAKLNGRTVRLKSHEVILNLSDSKIVDIPKTFRLKWLSVLAHPNIAYIFLMLGFYGLLFEITHPGVIFPGVAGAICLVLAFFGLQVLPTNYAGVVLIVLAIIMFLAEIKVTSYGLLTIGGIISMFAGSLMLFSSPDELIRVSIPLALAFTLATLVIALFLVFVVVRIRKKRVTTGIEGLVGKVGEVKIWKERDHRVFVHGELWDAVSDSDLSEKDRVEIIKVKNMVLVVKKVF